VRRNEVLIAGRPTAKVVRLIFEAHATSLDNEASLASGQYVRLRG
jgi:hypothetical protein